MCGVSGVRTLIYLLEVSFRQDKYENIINRLQEYQSDLPAKMHRDGRWARFGRPMGSAGPTSPPLATVLLWYTAWWALVLIRQCWGPVGLFGLSGGPLLHVLHRTRSSATFVCVFFVFSSYSGLVLLKT